MEWNGRDDNGNACVGTSWCGKDDVDKQTRTPGRTERNACYVVAHKKWLTCEEMAREMGM